MSERDVYTAKEAAHRLSISTRSLYTLVETGQIDQVWAGPTRTTRMFKATELARYIASLPTEKGETAA